MTTRDNADPDPVFFLIADPDPDQGLFCEQLKKIVLLLHLYCYPEEPLFSFNRFIDGLSNTFS